MIDSSPSSAESNFRELDEVFLQTQTRIWLGEVLGTRLNEDLHISDLLQDGEILFEISKVLWDLLLGKCMELRHLKHKYGPFGSKKSSGRYRPYSNVDSFLKVCKILGLSGIDLFSPSDVVEKRDIRKVCICIRALSKKARSKQLSVPDFDVVIYSVAMPTSMVGGIRRSLESSGCTLSSSSSYSSRKGSQVKLKQKYSYSPSSRDDDSSGEESDEAESRYMGENSFSSPSKFGCGDGVNLDLKNSSEAHSVFGGYWRQNLENGHQLDEMYHADSGVNDEEKHNNRNGTMNVGDISFTLGNDEYVVGDSSCINEGENNYISDYLAFSDVMVHATAGNTPVIDDEENMYDFFSNVDSQGLSSNKRGAQNGCQKKFSDDEDMEVSSTTSMSSVLGRLLNLEFDDLCDADDSSSANVYSSLSVEHGAENHYKDLSVFSQEAQSETAPQCASIKYVLPSLGKCEFSCMESLPDESCGTKTNNLKNTQCQETLSEDNKYNETVRINMLGSGSDKSWHTDSSVSDDFCSYVCDVTSSYLRFPYNSMSAEESERFSKQLPSINVEDFSIKSAPLVVSDYSSFTQESPCQTISENNPCLPVKTANKARENDHASYSILNNISAAENCGQDERERDLGISAESISHEKKDTGSQLPPGNHGRKPLLKAVIKGTAIAGVLFLLLQIRKHRANNVQETDNYSEVSRYRGSKFSSAKQQTKSRRKGVYPVENLKLGN